MSDPKDEVERLREDLARATRAREILLASIAHDLRNPLNTFAMSTGLLKDDLERGDFDPARGLSLVARLDRASHRMQALVEDLLEANRVETKKVPLTLRNERVGPILEDAVTQSKATVVERGANLVALPTGEELHVRVDRSRAIAALAKLVAFSLRATGERGTIELFASATAGARVVIGVRSIPPGGLTTLHDEGRGSLALLIGRGLFEQMGGTVTLEGTPSGPQITIVLPAVAPE